MISVVAVTATGGRVGMSCQGCGVVSAPCILSASPPTRSARRVEPVDVRTIPPIAARSDGPLDPARRPPSRTRPDEADARAGAHGARRPALQYRADAGALGRRAA